MIFSIQLLDFNNDNSSKSFINNSIPTDEDKKTFLSLYNNHEEYLEDKYEENEMFCFFEFDFDDIEQMSGISVDKTSFDKSDNDCNLFNMNNFGRNKTNGKSFEFLLNLFDEMGASFIDENFEEKYFNDIKELIKEKQQKSLPIVFNYFLYSLE